MSAVREGGGGVWYLIQGRRNSEVIPSNWNSIEARHLHSCGGGGLRLLPYIVLHAANLQHTMPSYATTPKLQHRKSNV